MSAADARHWIEGFEAAAVADRRVRATTVTTPNRALSLALPLITAARTALAASPALAVRRTREDEAVRRLWNGLRHPRP